MIVGFNPDDDMKNIKTFDNKIQNYFVLFGELLANVKKAGEFKKKSGNFKWFIENECNISLSYAKKLIDIYDIFIDELDLSIEDVIEIGIDRLNLIKNIVKKEDLAIAEEWIEKAKSSTIPELKEHVSEYRHKNKKPKDFKEILTEQFLQRFCVGMNCSVKHLLFLFAVYFNDLNEIEFTELFAEIKAKLQNKSIEEMIFKKDQL